MSAQTMASHNHLHGHPKPDQTAQFGFWVYLMTDCVLFATLFAAYAVLRNATAGGPGGADIFNLSSILLETFILLTSSFTCGLAMLAAHKGNRSQVASWLTATFFLGASFLALELTEFHQLIAEGNGFQASAFLS
jgi:cytochrome o ubiquinol oxidase subunit 3